MESRESFGKRMIQEARMKNQFILKEKNVPTDPDLYARVKAEANESLKFIHQHMQTLGW